MILTKGEGACTHLHTYIWLQTPDLLLRNLHFLLSRLWVAYTLFSFLGSPGPGFNKPALKLVLGFGESGCLYPFRSCKAKQRFKVMGISGSRAGFEALLNLNGLQGIKHPDSPKPRTCPYQMQQRWLLLELALHDVCFQGHSPAVVVYQGPCA